MVEKTLGITLDVTAGQLEEFLTVQLKNAIRNKERDLANGNVAVDFPKTTVETLSAEAGDDSKIDTTATTAVFNNGQYRCADAPYSVVDDFEDGTIDTSIISFSGSTSGSGGNSLTETVEGSGLLQNTHFEDLGPGDNFSSSRQETIEIPDGSLKIEFTVASDRIEAFAQGTNTNGASASLTINLRDLAASTDQVIVSQTASSDGNGDTGTATVENGTWEIRQQPDGTADVIDPSGNDQATLANGIPSDPALFVEHTATANSIGSSGEGRAESSIDFDLVERSPDVFQPSVVETTGALSFASDLTDVFLDVVDSQPLDSSLTTDFSADGGTNFELSDIDRRTLVDLANLSNPGSNAELRFDLIPSSDTTASPRIEDYVLKGFTD